MARLSSFPRLDLIACVVVCLGAMSGGVCAQRQTGGAEKAKTVLRGTVVNSVTQQPVGRAVVLSPDGRFATMTNERGQFEMVLKEKQVAPAPGTLGDSVGGAVAFFPRPTILSGGTGTSLAEPGANGQTTVDRPGFLIARRNGFLNRPALGTPGIAVAPDQEEINIPITPESRIVGKVTLADGDGARGMQVALYRRIVQNGRMNWQPAGQAEVKSDGEFRMADLEAGDYKLFSLELNDQDPVNSNPRGQQFGYPPDYYPGAADFASGAVIQLGAGETFQASLTPERRPYYPIHIGGASTQIGGVVPQVEVWRDGHPGPGYSLGFDFRNGSIGGSLPDGNYVVKVMSAGERVATGMTNLSVHGGPATGMVTLLGGTVVTVQVTEAFANSAPAQGGELAENSRQGLGDSTPLQTRMRRSTSTQVTLSTADEFTFQPQLAARPPADPETEGLEIPDVTPGEYRVEVRTPIGYSASVRCGGTDLQKANLVVAPGATLPPIEVVLRDDGGEISGSVVEIANRNRTAPTQTDWAAGYVYFVLQGETADLKETLIQPNGEFQTGQLAPGTYRVLAFAEPRPDLEWANEDAMKKYDGQMVTLAPGQKEKIRISLSGE